MQDKNIESVDEISSPCRVSLSRSQSLRLAAVLEDCSDQLDILGHTLTVQINSGRRPAAEQKAMLTKQRTDCQCISQQVSKLQLELEEKQRFSSLYQAVKEDAQRKEARFRDEKAELVQEKQTLKRLQEECRQKNEKLQDMDQLIKDLTRQLNEKSMKIANRKSILERHKELESKQDKMEGAQTEKLLDEQRKVLRKQLDEEMRVHEQTTVFLENQHQALELQLQKWQQRSEQMLEQKQEQLNSVCWKKIVILDKLEEMRNRFKEMEQEVKEDREEQEKLRLRKAQVKAVIKLQAWWRECMVRRGLGKKKKKGKNAKKNKGKKKK